MITGCNTNISHREMVFHVQTEDSGRANPHIISHVYYGGTIVGSRKQDYSDAVESPDLDREVRSRIEEQHKAMLTALLNGEFDQAITGQPAERPRSGGTAPGRASVGAGGRRSCRLLSLQESHVGLACRPWHTAQRRPPDGSLQPIALQHQNRADRPLS